MFKKAQLDLASKKIAKDRISDTKAAAATSSARPVAQNLTDSEDYSLVLRAARWIIALPGRVWNWIKSIDIIGLANIALLSVIVVMFTILLMNVFGCKKSDTAAAPAIIEQPVVAETEQPAVEKAEPVRKPSPRPVRPAKVVATVSVDPQTLDATISLPLKPALDNAGLAIANIRPSGDVIVDGRYISEARLAPGDVVEGNLILQNMRRFNLPCGIRVSGNIILRNVGLLRFCNEFAVDGNIYVNRDSSFGPIPETAHVGGQVIF